MENFHHKCPTVLIPGFSGFSGSGSRVWVQVLEVALFRNKLKQKKQFTWHLGKKNNNKNTKKTLVPANAGDEKNLQPGRCKFIFLIDFPEIFSFLL